jgi:hypothetical protein
MHELKQDFITAHGETHIYEQCYDTWIRVYYLWEPVFLSVLKVKLIKITGCGSVVHLCVTFSLVRLGLFIYMRVHWWMNITVKAFVKETLDK